MKSLRVICFTLLLCTGYASGVEKVEPIIVEPQKIETIEVVTVCPDGSKYAGEKIPGWVVGEESINYFCNSEDESVIAE